MKLRLLKPLVVLVLALAAAAALAATAISNQYGGSIAQLIVDVFQPTGISDTAALRIARRGKVVYDSGVVGAGAVIDSPLLDVTGIEGLYVVADNSAGAATRNFTLDTYLDDGTTLIDTGYVVRTVAASTKERGTIGPNYGGGLGTPALIFAFPITLPTKVKVHLVAGGAANGRLVVFGR